MPGMPGATCKSVKFNGGSFIFDPSIKSSAPMSANLLQVPDIHCKGKLEGRVMLYNIA